jgi:LysR family transcriptional regulator, glycine cleavage system transcriptional activator
MTQPRLPNLSALRTFEAVSRCGSMVAAATELCVTHGAVSKQIQALEQELGTPLFHRRNRGVHLTRQGAWLAERLGVILGTIYQTMRDYRTLDAAPGPLTVSCEPTLCLRFLIPAVSDLKRHTGLDIRVLAAGGPLDFRQGHVDVAIRRNDFAIPADVTATPIADEWMGAVATPTLAAEPMGDMIRLHSETRPHAWADWVRQSGWQPTGGEMAYEHFYLAIQAAHAGQGVALASIHMVAADIGAGSLQAPHGFTRDGTHYVALHSAGVADERVTLFTDWLKHRMNAHLTLITDAI